MSVFESTKADIAEKITQSTVPTTAIKTLLKTYLESGTERLEIKSGRAKKLLSVGLLTVKSVGGKTSNSSSGLNDVTTQ